MQGGKSELKKKTSCIKNECVCVCGESKERKTVQLSEQTSGMGWGYFFVEWGEQVGGGGR